MSRQSSDPALPRYLCSPACRVARAFLVCLVLLLPASASTVALAAAGADAPAAGEAFTDRFISASFENVKGHYRKAAESFLKLLVEQPSNAAAHYALSKAYLGLGVVDSARTHAEKCVQFDPSNKYYVAYLAVLSHRMNDFARAAILFRQLADIEPGSTEALAMLALEYLSATDAEKALGVFLEILAIDPKNEPARAQVLLMQIQLAHYQDAIVTLKEFIGKGENQEKLLLTLGELYTQTKQYEQAYSTLDTVVREHPVFLSAWFSLFDVSVQTGNMERFSKDLERFYTRREISRKQKIDLTNIVLVRSFKDSTYVSPAAVMISALIRHYPRSGQTWLISGRAEIQKKHPFEAEVFLRKALQLDKADVDIREELVTSLMMQKKYREARKALSEAMSYLPSKRRRLSVMEGELLYRSGELRKSAVLLEKALRWHEVRKEKWLFMQAAGTLAFCYDQLGLPDRSISLYERILEVDPGNALMMNNLAYILALEGKKLEMAKELAMKATAAEPANAGFLDTLGWACFRLGEFAKAKEFLEKAAGFSPDEPEILEHLSKTYEKLGDTEKAKDLMDRIAKLKGG
ncbi:MAG: tetratricopeptide repeat protein [Chlorobiaceae bacterium]|nr:tetratricopeptide repeat protein [Chlorobiaceae bacterium]